MIMSSGESTPRHGIVVSVGMQKGGVAKTTNTLHLAAALAERGHRVLLWDVDENYGATKVFGVGTADVLTTMATTTYHDDSTLGSTSSGRRRSCSPRDRKP